MLKNYLRICFRNIQRNRVFSFINIVGLAIGIAACLLILQYVSFESSFDQFHKNKDRVFRTDVRNIDQGEDRGLSSYTAYKLGPTIKETVPGVTHFTRTHPQYYGAVVTYKGTNEEDTRQFFEEDKAMYFVDQDFFEMFDYKLLKGNRSSLLTDPMSIVVTESMVNKYLPNEAEPLGKFLNVDGGWYPGTYKITGVLEDLPGNTFFSFGFLLPVHELLKNGQYQEDDGWGWNNFATYVMIDPNTTRSLAEDQAKNVLNDRNEDEDQVSNSRSDIEFTSLNDFHLNDQSETSTADVSERALFFFTIIALFIIGIAWLNYINLATAQAIKRSKEIGIRKVVGAVKGQLVFQFLLEAFIVNLMAFGLAMVLAYLTLPFLGSVMGKSLEFGTGVSLTHWVYFGVIFLLGTLLSGFYPAIVLSGFKPVLVIKGNTMSGHSKFGLRQVLVVAQLMVGLFLISGTMVVYKQLEFMRTSDLGLKVEQVLSIRGPRVFDDRDKMGQDLQVFKNKVRGLAAVSSVSGSDAIPGGDYNWGTSMIREGQDESQGQRVMMMWVDESFHDAYGMELLAGRFHSKDLRGEERQVVVNETTIKNFSFESPEEAIGKKMKVGDHVFPIIGVLKDYHWFSLKEEKLPILLNFTEYGTNISVRLGANDIRNTMTTIREEYESAFPNNPFDYYFMDEFFNRQYESDRQFGQIFSAFSLVAIVIACLGLFGLASFTLSLRVKEIGIRKVLGATLLSILTMLYKDYIKLILIAAVIGLPLVYLSMQNWLDDYTNRISITLDLMVVPIIVLMLITILTIGFQSMRAALANPTSSLRDE